MGVLEVLLIIALVGKALALIPELATVSYVTIVMFYAVPYAIVGVLYLTFFCIWRFVTGFRMR